MSESKIIWISQKIKAKIFIYLEYIGYIIFSHIIVPEDHAMDNFPGVSLVSFKVTFRYDYDGHYTGCYKCCAPHAPRPPPPDSLSQVPADINMCILTTRKPT